MNEFRRAIYRHLLILALVFAGATASLAQTVGDFFVANDSGKVYRVVERLGNGGIGVAFLVETMTESGLKQEVMKLIFKKHEELATKAHITAMKLENNPHLVPIRAVGKVSLQTPSKMNPQQLAAANQIKSLRADATAVVPSKASVPFSQTGDFDSQAFSVDISGTFSETAIFMPPYRGGSAADMFAALKDPKEGAPSQRLAKRAALAAQFAEDVSEALEVMGRSGRTHNDLKPENVFVDVASGKPIFVLADYDMIRAIGQTEKTASGSHGFIAPERYVLNHKNDIASDFYSLGVSIISLLSEDSSWLTELRVASQKMRIREFAEIISEQIVSIREGARDAPMAVRAMIDDVLSFAEAATVQSVEARRQALQGLAKIYPPARRLGAKASPCKEVDAIVSF